MLAVRVGVEVSDIELDLDGTKFSDEDREIDGDAVAEKELDPEVVELLVAEDDSLWERVVVPV